MNEELEVLYEDIIALGEGKTVYGVIPDVLPENIDSWRKQLLDEGFYVNIDFLGSTTDIIMGIIGVFFAGIHFEKGNKWWIPDLLVGIYFLVGLIGYVAENPGVG